MALLVVSVLLLLCGLTVLGVSRVTLLNESMVGGASDHQRAFAAAEAVMRDAEADVLAGRGVSARLNFPFAPEDITNISDSVRADPAAPCRSGICVPQDMQQLLDIDAWPAGMVDASRTPPAFAEYGQFTGAATGRGNPYLTSQARYWVEVFEYAVGAGIAESSPYQPDTTRPYVFRITALVPGNRPGTRVVLREVFIPSPLSANP